jgi:hypothetical protein
MLSARRQSFQKMLSVAGSVGVLAGVVLGADAGVLVYGVSGPLTCRSGRCLRWRYRSGGRRPLPVSPLVRGDPGLLSVIRQAVRLWAVTLPAYYGSPIP